MLSVDAPFPENDSTAFVRHTAEAVRIVRRNRDGTAFVIRKGLRPAERKASDSFTIPMIDLFATEREAKIMPRFPNMPEAKPMPEMKARARRPRRTAR